MLFESVDHLRETKGQLGVRYQHVLEVENHITPDEGEIEEFFQDIEVGDQVQIGWRIWTRIE